MGRRLTIIGGGVMGLMTAYYAVPLADAVLAQLAVQRGKHGVGLHPMFRANVLARDAAFRHSWNA